MTKKMRHPSLLLVLALFLSSSVQTVTHAQKATPAPVPDDADFAEFVKKATTKSKVHLLGSGAILNGRSSLAPSTRLSSSHCACPTLAGIGASWPGGPGGGPP